MSIWIGGPAPGTYAPSGVPSYVASQTRRYDPTRNAYNWKPSNTRRLRASLGKAQAGAGLAHHAFVGDSETAHFVGAAGSDQLGMWPRIYRSTLASLGVPIGGTGTVVAANSGSATDPRWAFSAGWSNANVYRASSAAGATATFTSPDAGTTVDLYYFNSAAPFTVAIDGGSAVTVTPPGSAGGVQTLKYTVTGLTSATHTVVVTTTNTSPVYLLGCNVYGASGLLVHNIAQYGSRASGAQSWTDTSSALYVTPAWKPMVYTPAVVWIALGVNDINTGTPATTAAVTAALTTIAANFPSSDVVLVGQYQPQGVSLSTWQAHIAALYGLADTLDVPLLDLLDRSGGYTVANTNGLMGDGTHPNSAAQRDWGRNAALLAAA